MLQLNATFRPNKPARALFQVWFCLPLFLPTNKKHPILWQLLQPNRASLHRPDRRIHSVQICAKCC